MSSGYKDYAPATLKRLQGVLLGMLDDFIALCDRHGLRWWSEGGTIIGALREGGMLAWDDDIDLCLVREDFDRFLSLVETELGDKYYVLDANRFPGYPLMTARLCLRGTKFREECMKGVDAPFGIFLDLYCFDHLADGEKEGRRQWLRAWFWGKLMVLRTVRSPVLYFGGAKAALTRVACFFGHYALRLSTTRAFLVRRARHWAKLCAGRETKRIFFPFAPMPFKNGILLDDLFPVRELPFDGRMMRIPKKAKEFLEKEYGDIMVPPPPEKRHNHPPLELDFGDGGQGGGAAGIPLSARQAALKELAFRMLDDLERAGARIFAFEGTALGAARHGDMIPWDDDIDFGVLREDLPRVLEALRGDPDLYVWDWNDDPAGTTPLRKVFWRIGPGDGRLRREAHVDLFVLDSQPAGRVLRHVLAWFLMGLRVVAWSKHPSEAARRAARRWLAPLRWVASLLAAPFPMSWVKRLFEWLAAWPGRTTGELWVPTSVGVPGILRTFRRSHFGKTVQMPFGGREIPVPSNTDEYLGDAYGDWRTPPPVSKRRGGSWSENGDCLFLMPSDAARAKR